MREYVAHGDIEVRKIGTDDNVANVFTKSLAASVHHKHVNSAHGILPRVTFAPAACQPRFHCPLHQSLHAIVFAQGISHRGGVDRFFIR
eukprot:4690140-Pleurochrysis_carterae.AAC.1